jgi:hypothetical protein
MSALFTLMASPYLLLAHETVLRNLQGEAQAHHLGATGARLSKIWAGICAGRSLTGWAGRGWCWRQSAWCWLSAMPIVAPHGC